MQSENDLTVLVFGRMERNTTTNRMNGKNASEANSKPAVSVSKEPNPKKDLEIILDLSGIGSLFNNYCTYCLPSINPAPSQGN